jgi:hypothetical protein
MKVVVGEVNELEIASREVSNFYGQHWKRKIALSDYSFYKWQFMSSPSDAGLDHCCIAIDEDSKQILGVMGLNTRPFFLGGEEVKGAELTTWIVVEELHGKGIGPRILRNIQQNYDVLIGMGISDMALPVYMRSGFRYLRAIPRFIKVFNWEMIEGYAQYTGLAKRLTKYWKGIRECSFCVEDVDNKRIEKIEGDIVQNHNLFSRDYEYITWRYVNHPVFCYKHFMIYSERDNGAGVYVCFREETSAKDLRLLHVLDFFGDQRDMSAAISFIHSYCNENNFYLAEFYCTSTFISRFFISSGWFSNNDDSCFQFPHLFHPIEFRNPPTTSLIYWSKNNFIELADISKLYITKQDADFDRPTMANANDES